MAVIGGSNGSAVLTSDDERLDFDAMPEYVREPRASYRDSYVSKSCYEEDDDMQLCSAKSAEIETLWPGVSADFLHGSTSKRQPSFYLGIGFLGGLLTAAVCTGIVIGGMAWWKAANSGQHLPAQIVMAQGKAGNPAKSNIAAENGAPVAVVTTRQPVTGDPEVIVPIFQTYTVKTGDTLAGIALQGYKRATPRLLDEICKANGMRNANVLSLGQTLTLPEYRPQNRQVAAGPASLQ